MVPCRRSFNRRWFGISEDWQYGETREFSSSVTFCLPSFQRFRSSRERHREREGEFGWEKAQAKLSICSPGLGFRVSDACCGQLCCNESC